MGTLVVSVVVLLLVVATQPKTVFSSASTIIRSPSGWTAMEGSNFTLGCWVSQTSNADANTICRSRIRFTKNFTSVPEGPRHSRSGATRDGQTNRINCTMTIFRIQSGDSGMYGCCWPDVDGNCSRHPTQTLTVLPATSPAPTTTPVAPSLSDRLTGRTPGESNEVVYQSISPRSGLTAASGKNEAFNQRTGSSIHKTIWPLLLVIGVLVVIIIFGKQQYVKRKSADGHSVPTGDPACPESPGHLSQIHDHCVVYDLDGVVNTTTTTTTTTVLNVKPDEESLR